MEEKVYVLYYDLPAIQNKVELHDFINEIIMPIMEKFESVGKCAVLLPKDEVMYKVMSKEQALRQINEVKEYIEAWEENNNE